MLESRSMPEESSESTAHRHFHWCLAAVLLPVLSLPFEWFAVYQDHQSSRATPDRRRWSRLLLGIATVDTIVAALVIALIASGAWGWHTLTERQSRPRPGEAVRIGVTTVVNPETAEAQIGTVAIDSPAERAGLRPGDVIVSLDGDPIRRVEDLASRIRSSTPGVPRTLRIRRAGEELELAVKPELRTATREPVRPLFDAGPTPSCAADAASYASAFSRWRGLWAGVILILLFWLMGRWAQPHTPPLWSWIVAALGSSVLAGSLVVAGVCLGVGGRSVAGPLLADLAQSIAALVVGVIAMRYMAGRGLLGARLSPILSDPRAIVLGFFYLFAVNGRLSIFNSALEAFGHVQWSAMKPDDSLAWSVAALGWPGTVLLAFTIVVVGPLEEEVLFRGVILPRLTPWLGSTWAIVATSVIFAVLHERFGSEPLGIRPAGVFVLALALGWARLRTGGLNAPIAMHVVTNALVSFATR